MKLKRKHLQLVLEGLETLLAEIKNQIITCPEPEDIEYAKRLQEYWAQRGEIERLIVKITSKSNLDKELE